MLIAAAQQEGLGTFDAGGDAADDGFGGAVGPDFMPATSARFVTPVEVFDHDALNARGGPGRQPFGGLVEVGGLWGQGELGGCAGEQLGEQGTSLVQGPVQ